MSNNLIVSISGVRGVVGDTLDAEIIVKYCKAFAETIHGKTIVIGNDSRVSGPFAKRIAIGTLMSMGYDVIDIGLCPTPTVQYMTELLNADCGIVITASHNPIEWNGLKFIDSDGLFLSPIKCKKMFDLADINEFKKTKWDQLGKYEFNSNAIKEHIKAILKLDFISQEKIREKKFKVALDTINGAGFEIINKLLRDEFSCEVVAINSEATGIFSHEPEPVPENLNDLCQLVKKHNCDIGIAVDPDVDRCVIINEKGEAIGEEYTLAIVTKLILSKKLGAVVKNMSTTMAIDDIAIYYNCPIHEAAVGEINVANKMIETDAVIGGEGNGGVMLPDIHIGRDAPIALALILQALTEFDDTISSLKESLPQYYIYKHKFSIEGKDIVKITSFCKLEYSNQKISEVDGLKIYADDYWIHIRKSNTEPIIRIIAESPDLERSKKICLDLEVRINEMV